MAMAEEVLFYETEVPGSVLVPAVDGKLWWVARAPPEPNPSVPPQPPAPLPVAPAPCISTPIDGIQTNQDKFVFDLGSPRLVKSVTVRWRIGGVNNTYLNTCDLCLYVNENLVACPTSCATGGEWRQWSYVLPTGIVGQRVAFAARVASCPALFCSQYLDEIHGSIDNCDPASGGGGGGAPIDFTQYIVPVIGGLLLVGGVLWFLSRPHAERREIVGDVAGAAKKGASAAVGAAKKAAPHVKRAASAAYGAVKKAVG